MTWNVAIAGRAIVGGVVLKYLAAQSIPATLLIIRLPALGIAAFDHRFTRVSTAAVTNR